MLSTEEEEDDALKTFLKKNEEAIKKQLGWESFEIEKTKRLPGCTRDGVFFFRVRSARKQSFMHDRGAVDETKYAFGVFDAKAGKMLRTSKDVAAVFAGDVSQADAEALLQVVGTPKGRRKVTKPESGMFGNPGAGPPRFASGVLNVDFYSHTGMRGPVFRSSKLALPTKDAPGRFEGDLLPMVTG